MVMPRLWASVLCAPGRCSTSDTVPMTRTTTGSLLWKKPSRKGGGSPRSRCPWGRWGRWAEGAGTPASAAPAPQPCQVDPEPTQTLPFPDPHPGLGTCTVPRTLLDPALALPMREMSSEPWSVHSELWTDCGQASPP